MNDSKRHIIYYNLSTSKYLVSCGQSRYEVWKSSRNKSVRCVVITFPGDDERAFDFAKQYADE